MTAVEILKLLNHTEPVGKDALLQAERENNLKLPPALFEFWSLSADSPLLSTADIWTKKRFFLWFFYHDIQEWIDGGKAYWEKSPSKYADNEYCQCAYDAEKNMLVSARADKAGRRYSKIMVYRKA